MHICVDLNKPDLARVLLMSGAFPDYQNSDGKTPFHVAVERGMEDMAKCFSESGVNAETKDAELMTVWERSAPEFKERVVPPPPPELPPTAEPEPPNDGDFWMKEGKCRKCHLLIANRKLLPCMHQVYCSECVAGELARLGVCPECEMAVYAAIPA